MWQHFFTNEKRHLNKYIYKMNDYPNYIYYKKDEMERYKGSWNSFFNNDNPISIEIGSGSGVFTSTLAEQNPGTNYIGFELRFKRLVSSAKKSKKIGLNNILFLRRRGEDVDLVFSQNSINNIYINFPEPWEKKINKRVVTKESLKKYFSILKENGKIYFKTDHIDYYKYFIDLIINNENFDIIFRTENLYTTEKYEKNIKTEFEKLFINKGIKIKYLEIQKRGVKWQDM